MCCDSWGHKESDTTEQLNWTELNDFQVFKCGCQLSHPVSLEPLCFLGSMTSS